MLKQMIFLRNTEAHGHSHSPVLMHRGRDYTYYQNLEVITLNTAGHFLPPGVACTTGLSHNPFTWRPL